MQSTHFYSDQATEYDNLIEEVCNIESADVLLSL